MEIRRKGIIFALDAALAVSVVIIILINSSYYFSTASKESMSQLQPVRIGSDVIALLDFGGSFDYAFEKDIEGNPLGDDIPQGNLNVSAYLPKNYAMRYAITDMKETPTKNPTYCPGTNCQLHSEVSFDSNGFAVLDQYEWIKIKPFTEPTKTANIKNPGPHFVSIGTTATTSTISATIEVDGNWTGNLVIFDTDTGSFLWGEPNYFPYFEPGNSPYNWINITNRGTQDLTVKWVRVVGDESYMRGAYSDDTITSIPLDRFIGSGERFISVVTPTGDFEGYHLVRYWVWLKTVSVT